MGGSRGVDFGVLLGPPNQPYDNKTRDITSQRHSIHRIEASGPGGGKLVRRLVNCIYIYDLGKKLGMPGVRRWCGRPKIQQILIVFIAFCCAVYMNSCENRLAYQ